MATFTIHEAQTNLSKLIARAEAGEEIVIARGQEPVAKLVPVAERKPKRLSGRLKGLVSIPDSFFFDPLPEQELRFWEGSDDAASR
jgi:prevent-host-death family protein